MFREGDLVELDRKQSKVISLTHEQAVGRFGLLVLSGDDYAGMWIPEGRRLVFPNGKLTMNGRSAKLIRRVIVNYPED